MSSSLRCLVLGGKGFIGSHLVDALKGAGHAVRVLDRPGAPLSEDTAGVEWIDGDFIHAAEVAEALKGVDVCFHLISTTLPKSSNADPVFDVDSNLAGTVKMLDSAVTQGVKKVVFISSGGTVYGVPKAVPIEETHPTDPTCSYGITKLAIEKYLELYRQLHGLDYVVLRAANPFGERQRTQASQGAVAVFLDKVLRGETVEIWGDGSVVRDYVYIGDLVRAMTAAMTYSGTEHIFNIGSGAGQSLNDVLDGIARITGREAKRRYVAARGFDVPVSVLSIARARAVLGWAPQVPFLDGLARFARWLEART